MGYGVATTDLQVTVGNDEDPKIVDTERAKGNTLIANSSNARSMLSTLFGKKWAIVAMLCALLSKYM